MNYEAGVRPGLRGFRYGVGAYDGRTARFRNPMDVIGRAYEPGPRGLDTAGSLAVHLAGVLLQLALPVVLLGSLGALAFLYGDQPAPWFGPSVAEWLTVGHLIVPLTFFAIQITNRRYGAGYAFAQIVLTWALGGIVLAAAGLGLPVLGGRILPGMNEVFGFGAALFVAQLFSVLIFDRTRGPRWWVAPLLASMWGGVLFCAIAFPLAYSGTAIDWSPRLLVYAEIMAAASVLLLLPYWFLRRIVPPLSGFGGY